MEASLGCRLAVLSLSVTLLCAVYIMVVGLDPHLRCEDASRHNASAATRQESDAVYALGTNGTLHVYRATAEALRVQSFHGPPVVTCITTTTNRIRRLQPVLQSMFRQRPTPTAIVVAPDVSVPWTIVRDAATRWSALAAVRAPVRVVRMPDGLGPLDKAWGCMRYAEHAALPSDAVLVVSDDDYRRGSGWLSALASRALLGAPEERRVVSFELPQYAASLRVRGSNGWAAYWSSFGSSAQLYRFAVQVEPACRCMDDVSIVGYLRGPRRCTVHNRRLDEAAFWRTKGVMAAGLQGKSSLHISMSGAQRLRMQIRCMDAMRQHDASVPDVLATDGRTRRRLSEACERS